MMCTDSANQIVSGHNATLFNGIVNALVTTDDENSDNAVVIAAKDYTVSNLTVSANAMLVYGILLGHLYADRPYHYRYHCSGREGENVRWISKKDPAHSGSAIGCSTAGIAGG